MEKLSLCIDIVFKKIFGVDENKDLLISLINSVVSPEDQVGEVTLLNPYNYPHDQEKTSSDIDVRAKNSQGKMLSIQIQISNTTEEEKKMLYGWGRFYIEQLEQYRYEPVAKSISIYFLNCNSSFDRASYHNVFVIKEKELDFQRFKNFEIHTIELKKWHADQNDIDAVAAKATNQLDRWIAFLTRFDLMRKRSLPHNLDTPEIRKAIDVVDVMNFDSLPW